jgi:hypothetical protein
MSRRQDILFVILGLALLALLAFHVEVAVLALVGGFACGSIYLFAGMLPDRNQSLPERAFTSAFLAMVLSCLVLILPGTLGAPHPGLEKTIIVIALLLPLAAIVFEVVRTPRVMRGILRLLGQR